LLSRLDPTEDAPMSTAVSLSGARVLVTGACGFIGSNLTRELVHRGAVVAGLDLASSDWARLPDGVQRISADLLDSGSLIGTLSTYDVVYHLAARTDLDGRSMGDYALNTEGTANLIAALVAAGGVSRFVHYSTQLVVGLFNESRFIDETEPFRTRTPYGESKIESERIVARLCATHAIDYTIIRPTSVYGPWGAEPYREFFNAVKHGRYVHVGRASNLVSLAYVKNLVDQTLLLSTHPDASNETFFGNDFHPYTMREIVDTAAAYYGIRVRRAPVWLLTVVAYVLGLFKVVGIKVPLYPFRLRNMRMTYCYDIQKSVRLGYDPRYDLSEGIQETLSWYDAHPAF
jgi:nucleoside-diphosphate-sugar epimerase